MIGSTTGLILSNLGNALQPAVVKATDLNPYDQSLIRIIVFGVSCVLLTKWFGWSGEWIRASFSIESLGMNFINLLSVFSGIRGFQELPVGVSLTTFYTWPIYLTLISQWERVKKHKELSEDNQKRLWMGIILSFIGLLVIFGPQWFDWFREGPSWGQTWIGFFWVTISAITHAYTIFYYHKKHPKQDSAVSRLGSLTLPSALLCVILMLWNPGKWGLGRGWSGSDDQFRWQVLMLSGFQATVGLGSFLLHFFSIPKLPKEWISSLSFLTLIAGYLFGWFFFGEKMNWRILLGTLLVFIGIGLVSRSLKGEFDNYEHLNKEKDETKQFIYDKLKLIALS